MPLVTPLSAEHNLETKRLAEFFNETLGFCPNSVLTMQRRPAISKAFINLNKMTKTITRITMGPNLIRYGPHGHSRQNRICTCSYQKLCFVVFCYYNNNGEKSDSFFLDQISIKMLGIYYYYYYYLFFIIIIIILLLLLLLLFYHIIII